MSVDLAVLYEHPDWQRPLFDVLDDRDLSYEAIDLKSATFSSEAPPPAPSSSTRRALGCRTECA